MAHWPRLCPGLELNWNREEGISVCIRVLSAEVNPLLSLMESLDILKLDCEARCWW